MEFNNRPIDQRASNQVPRYNYFAEQSRRAGYMGSYGGLFHPEYLQGHSQPQPHPHPHPHPHPRPPLLHPLLQPHDLHEAINREIEKQHIREEIILSEIARRRVLEAEVRRELMMERELALRRGDDGFPFGPPLGTGLDSTIRPPLLGIRSEGRSLDERVAVRHKERERKNVRHVNGEVETVPFQRCITVPKISEVMPSSEAVKEKEKVVVLAKPQEYKPGEKRKAANSSVADDVELLSAVIASKKAKEEWSCALCQVIATSEQALKDHVRGKKHKSKEAALRAQRAGKDYSIGFFPKKAVAPVGTKTVGSDGVISATQSLQNKTGEMNSKNNLKNNQLSGVKGMKNAGNGKKKKYKFWCEICQVGAYCQAVMNAHKVGKKHVRRLQEIGRNEDASSAVKEKDIVGVDDAGDGKNTTVENVGKAMATMSSNDHRTVNVEEHDATEATKQEGNGAISVAKPENNEDNDLAEPEHIGAVNAAKPDDNKATDDQKTDDVIIPGIIDAIFAPKSDDDKADDAPELSKAMDDKEVNEKVEQ